MMDEEIASVQTVQDHAIPTQVFLDAQGKEVDRHVGALSKEEVVKKLKELQVHPLSEETIHGME